MDAAREAAAKTIDERVNAFRATFPTHAAVSVSLQGESEAVLRVRDLHGRQFTYIRADAAELPALYELVDDWPSHVPSPNLVNFQVEHGVYIVPKVLERGYLAIGKQKLVFAGGR